MVISYIPQKLGLQSGIPCGATKIGARAGVKSRKERHQRSTDAIDIMGLSEKIYRNQSEDCPEVNEESGNGRTCSEAVPIFADEFLK